MSEQTGTLNAVAAIRVSTTKQGFEGDSPEAQKEQIQRYAENRGIKIVKYFEFLESASKTEQPMQKAVDYCNNPSHRVDIMIVKSIDRFTRGGSYAYSSLKMQLENHNVRLVDLYGIIGAQKVNTLEHLGVRYSWSVYDPTKNSEILEAERASDEKRDIMSRLMGAEIRYTRLGYWMRQPPYGYESKRVNTAHGRRTILVPHPTESVYIIKMFELRARNTMSDKQIADELNQLGYRSRIQCVRSNTNRAIIIGERGGRKMTAKMLQKKIQNPIYAGVNNEKWSGGEAIKCHFKGLVSTELFNAANRGRVVVGVDRQQVAYDSNGAYRSIPVTNHTIHYPYRRVVLCPLCEKPFSASASRGRSGKYYMAYHCNRGHKYYRVPKGQFEIVVKEFAKTIKISKTHMNRLRELVAEEWQLRHRSYFRDIERKRELLQETKDQVRIIANNMSYTHSPTALRYMEEELESLELDINKIEADILHTETNTPLSIDEVLQKVHYYTEHLDSLLLSNITEVSKERLFGTFFDSLPTYTDLLEKEPDRLNLNTAFELKGSR